MRNSSKLGTAVHVWAMALVALAMVGATSQSRGAGPELRLDRGEDSIAITLAGQPLAEYRFRDSRITRPYFCHLHAPGGLRVTRNHPPIEGQDLIDHDTFHPGLWMSFGDLNGADFWRLKEPVVEREIELAGPEDHPDGFVVRRQYLGGEAPICDETCHYRIVLRSDRWILLWSATLTPTGNELVFGDQEEMGLGVRVATPLAVVRGGQLRDSEERLNEKQIWGQTAQWCEYSGQLAGRRVGLLVVPDRANFRPCWWHVRDYGLMAANPFGRQALTGGEVSRVVIPRGQSLTLQFAVLVFNEDPATPLDRAEAVRDAQQLLTDMAKPKVVSAGNP